MMPIVTREFVKRVDPARAVVALYSLSFEAVRLRNNHKIVTVFRDIHLASILHRLGCDPLLK